MRYGLIVIIDRGFPKGLELSVKLKNQADHVTPELNKGRIALRHNGNVMPFCAPGVCGLSATGFSGTENGSWEIADGRWGWKTTKG